MDQSVLDSHQDMETNGICSVMSANNRLILLALLNGNENLESCLALADILTDKGFKIVLAVEKNIDQELIGNSPHQINVYDCQPTPDLAKQLDLNCLNTSPEEKLKNVSHHLVANAYEFVRRCEPFNEQLVQRLKPSLIIVESLVCSPALTNSGIPWVWLNFSPPNVCKNDSLLPPAWSGLAANKQNEFPHFREHWNNTFSSLKFRIDNWCAFKGAPQLPDTIFHPHSPYLNIYVNPKEMDDKLISTYKLKNWLQIDSLVKQTMITKTKISIPNCFAAKPGKVVYLSMGQFASVQLMKRLVSLLSDSEHNFIVSKGPFHSEYELANNMWGEEEVPLNDVIRSVDLVITCGDTTAIIQCFLSAKPMILMPLFGDQLDNRSRLKECGFGWGLDPFTCNKETLHCMIDYTLVDKPVKKRLMRIAQTMASEDLSTKLNEIEKVLKRHELAHA